MTIEGRHPCALDACHYSALVVQAIEEGLGPPVEERSPYDQRFLDTFFGIRHRHPLLLQSALHAVVYSDDLLIPNIDINPGQLLHGPDRLVRFAPGGGYHRESPENLEFLMKLAPLVLRHPIGRLGDESLAVLKLYFESAVHTPRVRSIRDALELWAAVAGREPAKHGWYLLSESE